MLKEAYAHEVFEAAIDWLRYVRPMFLLPSIQRWRSKSGGFFVVFCLFVCFLFCLFVVVVCVCVCVPLSLDFLLFVITVVVYGQYPMPSPEKPGETTKRSDVAAHLNADSFRYGSDCVASSTAFPPPPPPLSLSLSQLPDCPLTEVPERPINTTTTTTKATTCGVRASWASALRVAKICGTFPFDSR